MMKFFGFDTEEVNKSRILEIGCSFGGNIIPAEIAYPDAEIVGIDLSKVQIDGGNEIINTIGLDNIKLYHKNILDYKGEYGKFDDIICHGVFSWVPDEVKEAILRVMKDGLKENGVGLISYNIYPGWKRLDIARDLMIFSVDNLVDRNLEVSEENKVEMSKNTLKFYLENSLIDNDTKNVLGIIMEKDPHYVYHEYFEKFNDPIYFYQFVKKIEKYDLTHVIDASFNNSYPTFSSDIKLAVENECGENRIAKEQYYDFLRNTQFRTSLITHKENIDKMSFTSNISFDKLDDIYVRGYYEILEDKVIYNEKEMPKINREFYQYLTDIYPKNVKIKDLVERFGKEIYQSIFNLIYIDCIDFDTLKRGYDIFDRIGPKNLEYIKYNLRKDSKITFSNYKGEILSMPEYFYILEDVLHLSIEDMEKEVILKLENGEIVSQSNKKFEEIAENIGKYIFKMINTYELFR